MTNRTPKSKPKQTKKSHPSPDLRQFRHDVAVLKKKGLVSKRVDARSVKPTKSMLAKVKEFRDVISGNVTVWKVPKRNDYINLLNSGERGTNQRVVLNKGEYIYKGMIAYKDGDEEADGKAIRKIRKSSGQTFEEYLDRLAANMPLKGNEGYAFRFYGNNSGHAYHDIDTLKESLMRYGTVEAYRRKLIRSHADRILSEHTEIFVTKLEGYEIRRGPLVSAPKGREGTRFREAMPPELDVFAKKTKPKRKSKRERVRGK